jgi:hypothetical protein
VPKSREGKIDLSTLLLQQSHILTVRIFLLAAIGNPKLQNLLHPAGIKRNTEMRVRLLKRVSRFAANVRTFVCGQLANPKGGELWTGN